jgi:hypothetical protein
MVVHNGYTNIKVLLRNLLAALKSNDNVAAAKMAVINWTR